MSTRDAFVQKMHAKIDEWNVELDLLKAKAEVATAEKRTEYQKQVNDLNEKRAVFEKRIEALKQAGDSAWEDLKTGTQLAWTAMEDALKSARSRFQ